MLFLICSFTFKIVSLKKKHLVLINYFVSNLEIQVNIYYLLKRNKLWTMSIPWDRLVLHVTVGDDDSLGRGRSSLQISSGGRGRGVGALVISFPATAGQIAYWKIKVTLN